VEVVKNGCAVDVKQFAHSVDVYIPSHSKEIVGSL